MRSNTGGRTGRLRMSVTNRELICQVSDPGPASSGLPRNTSGSQRPSTTARIRRWPYEPGHGLWLVRHINVNSGPAGSQVTVAFTMLRSGIPKRRTPASHALARTGITWSIADSWRIRATTGLGPTSSSRQPSARSFRWAWTIWWRAAESMNVSPETSTRSRRGFLAASAPRTSASAQVVTSASPASRTTVREPPSRSSTLTDTDSSVTPVIMSPRGVE